MPAKKQEVITVVAELSVQHSGDEKTKVIVRSYDKAWRLSSEHAQARLFPVTTVFLGFVRKD
jgi:hypothetical protein